MQPIIELKSELEGIIKLEIIKEDGTLKEAEGLNTPFYNLITDAGLNFVSGNTTIVAAANYCRVGTSSTTPTVSDTTLGSQTGSSSPPGTTTSSAQYTEVPYYSGHQKVYTFAVGAVSGNLTEIGFFSASSGGTMWSRALIKDSGGNPTTLTLLATEQLKVTYIVRRYIPTTITGSFTLSTNGTNTTINYNIKPANINNIYASWLGGYVSVDRLYLWAYETDILGNITAGPSGTASSVIQENMDSYIQGSFYRQTTVVAGTATANFSSGIGSIVFFHNVSSEAAYSTGYQCSFSPKIMKTSSQTLSIGIRLSWGRTTQQ